MKSCCGDGRPKASLIAVSDELRWTLRRRTYVLYLEKGTLGRYSTVCTISSLHVLQCNLEATWQLRPRASKRFNTAEKESRASASEIPRHHCKTKDHSFYVPSKGPSIYCTTHIICNECIAFCQLSASLHVPQSPAGPLPRFFSLTIKIWPTRVGAGPGPIHKKPSQSPPSILL